MAAYNILRVQQNDNRLQEQLDLACGVTGRLRLFLEQFFEAEGIYSLDEVSEIVETTYQHYVARQIQLSYSQKQYYSKLLDQVQYAYLEPKHPILKAQMDEISGSGASKRKAMLYLMKLGLSDAGAINYKVRKGYLRTLQGIKTLEEIKVLDCLKLNAITKEWQRNPMRNVKLRYVEQEIFLLYHPDPNLAKTFYYVRDKEELLFDFSSDAPVTMKKQIFAMLNHVLEEKENWHDRRERFLIPLKLFYLFCIEHQIADIELLELGQIKAFKDSMKGCVGSKESIYIQIVDNIQKYLFLSAKQTNWAANAWYLERFTFTEGRCNPARQIKRFSFEQVLNSWNRKLFQEYMKYEIGISQKSLQTVKTSYYQVKAFLIWLDTKKIRLTSLTAPDLEAYIEVLDQKQIQPEAFNGALLAVSRYLSYLVTKQQIKQVPLRVEYYLKRTFSKHNNRTVSTQNQMQILQALKTMPQYLRLMYLNLWCIGLRINEVCVLKGNSYRWDGTDAWLTLYQNKMKAEKQVPIPHMLYRLMDQYIKENQIQPEEYIFQNKKGGAYLAGTFCKQIQRELKKAGIQNYHFKSHDFRHTVATYLYAHDASIEAIRDYLGHKDSEMTKQYLDYLPELLDAKNEAYFQNLENQFIIQQEKR